MARPVQYVSQFIQTDPSVLERTLVRREGNYMKGLSLMTDAQSMYDTLDKVEGDTALQEDLNKKLRTDLQEIIKKTPYQDYGAAIPQIAERLAKEKGSELRKGISDRYQRYLKVQNIADQLRMQDKNPVFVGNIGKTGTKDPSGEWALTNDPIDNFYAIPATDYANYVSNEFRGIATKIDEIVKKKSALSGYHEISRSTGVEALDEGDWNTLLDDETIKKFIAETSFDEQFGRDMEDKTVKSLAKDFLRKEITNVIGGNTTSTYKPKNTPKTGGSGTLSEYMQFLNNLTKETTPDSKGDKKRVEDSEEGQEEFEEFQEEYTEAKKRDKAAKERIRLGDELTERIKNGDLFSSKTASLLSSYIENYNMELDNPATTPFGIGTLEIIWDKVKNIFDSSRSSTVPSERVLGDIDETYADNKLYTTLREREGFDQFKAARIVETNKAMEAAKTHYLTNNIRLEVQGVDKGLEKLVIDADPNSSIGLFAYNKNGKLRSSSSNTIKSFLNKNGEFENLEVGIDFTNEGLVLDFINPENDKPIRRLMKFEDISTDNFRAAFQELSKVEKVLTGSKGVTQIRFGVSPSTGTFYQAESTLDENYLLTPRIIKYQIDRNGKAKPIQAVSGDQVPEFLDLYITSVLGEIGKMYNTKVGTNTIKNQ